MIVEHRRTRLVHISLCTVYTILCYKFIRRQISSSDNPSTDLFLRNFGENFDYKYLFSVEVLTEISQEKA